MDCSYFKEHILDELCGSEEYVKTAIELKGTNPAWSKTYLEMSANELEHASKLYKIYSETYASLSEAYKTIPEYLSACHTCVVSEYSERSTRIKELHAQYAW